MDRLAGVQELGFHGMVPKSTRDPLAREGPTMGEVSGGGPSVFTTCPVERFHVKVDL